MEIKLSAAEGSGVIKLLTGFSKLRIDDKITIQEGQMLLTDATGSVIRKVIRILNSSGETWEKEI